MSDDDSRTVSILAQVVAEGQRQLLADGFPGPTYAINLNRSNDRSGVDGIDVRSDQSGKLDNVLRRIADSLDLIAQLGQGIAKVSPVKSGNEHARNIYDNRVLWLTRGEAAEYAGVSVHTISNWGACRYIRTRKRGSARFDKLSIAHFLESSVRSKKSK